MPLYEYQCEACGERFEAIRKFSDPPLEACEKCGKGPIQRLVSSPAFQFKGSGWYITDYAKKSGSKDSSSAEKSDGGSSDKTSSDKPSGDKPSSEKPSGGTESSKSETPAKPAAPRSSKD